MPPKGGLTTAPGGLLRNKDRPNHYSINIGRAENGFIITYHPDRYDGDLQPKTFVCETFEQLIHILKENEILLTLQK